MTDTLTGLVLAYHSNFYTVQVGNATYACFLKGMIKKEGTDVAVGDRVTVDSLEEANAAGRITGVLERTNYLNRPKIANVTRALVVASMASPALDLMQADRYLTNVRLAGIPVTLCLSKIDLADDADLATVEALYAGLDIPVFPVAIHQPARMQALIESIRGETIVLAGLSGVGKSSLLNAMNPTFDIRTGEVSGKLQRGQHTTRHVNLLSLGSGTYVADTPGFSHLKFDTTDPHALEAVFEEFAPYRADCRFDDCLHLDEEDCAVQAHATALSASRLASYRVFQEEAKVFVAETQTTSQKETYGYKTVSRGKGGDVRILRLPGKQREASRRTQRQAQLEDQESEEDGTLE